MSDRGSEASAKTRGRRIVSLVALSLVAGAAVGAVGVYVAETRSGNAAAANCPLDDGLKQAIDAAARGEVAAVHALDAPFDARTIAFKDGSGAAKRVADYAGKSLLLNLWATWCVPCRAEMPALDALERQKGGTDLAVLPVNVDVGGDEKPKDFYAETNLTALPFLRDETMGVFNDLKGQGLAIGLPVSLLVDKAGCARAAITGPAEWASPDGLALIDVLKNGKA
ncbi:thiol:disulfide interchange protein TlpA [Aureimonas leprariae]|uniref:TlpA family protein disulfide reductase n=1 Tax=Plantimonas leprariae TaxID=2615207 RepID=A0A7V7TV11_9HYPH|nr:TlpA disulfide reductase family protein [Aureimonas leprariae]KAB0677023.1 TlpA family protein disulfide reductase [Aureimonas leprariae]